MTDLIPPTDEEITKSDFVCIHDAAFLLTGWPLKEGRPYYPDPTKSFNPEDYGLIFRLMYEEFDHAAKHNLIPYKHTKAINGVSFSIRPADAIIWALIKKHVLPHNLQKIMRLYQFGDTLEKKQMRAFINKVIFQCIFTHNSDLIYIQDYLNHPLIRKHGDDYGNKNEKKPLKRQLFDAIGFKASRGQQESQSELKVKTLNEVMVFDNVLYQYNVEAFLILIDLICKCRFEILSRLNFESFRQIIIADPVIVPYLKNAPEAILAILENELERFRCPIRYL